MSAIIDLKADSYGLCSVKVTPPPYSQPWVITNILDHNTFDPELTTTVAAKHLQFERNSDLEYLEENIENWFLCHACLRTDSISSYSSSDEKRRALWRGKLGRDGDGLDLIKVPCLPVSCRFTNQVYPEYCYYVLLRILSRTRFRSLFDLFAWQGLSKILTV